MKSKLQFDDGQTWSRLMDEIRAINNVAFLSKGKLDKHLQDRLEKSAEAAHRILLDEVSVEEYHGHVNVDKDWPTKEESNG